MLAWVLAFRETVANFRPLHWCLPPPKGIHEFLACVLMLSGVKRSASNSSGLGQYSSSLPRADTHGSFSHG